jgi:CRP-like cAMP-binding protein
VAKRAKARFDPKEFLTTVNHGRAISSFRKGDVFFSQGDPADAVFYLQKGKVKIAATSEQGKEAIVAVLGAGQFFGEGCLIGQPLRLGTAAAIGDGALMRVERAEMIRVLHAQPSFAEVFTAHLLIRNSRVEEDLVDQLFNSSEKRLARTLLLLANFGKEGKMEPISPKISQETLAEMVGTTRPRISLFMNKFRRMGLVEYNGDLKVHGALLSVLLQE